MACFYSGQLTEVIYDHCEVSSPQPLYRIERLIDYLDSSPDRIVCQTEQSMIIKKSEPGGGTAPLHALK